MQKRWFLGLLIFVFSFLIYTPSLNNDFVWDDVINIKKQNYKFENKSLFRNIIPKEKKNRGTGYYRPAITTSMVIDYRLWGDNPFGYHLTNNLLFSLTSLLFFILTLLILKEFHIGSKEYIAGLASFIFIVHPMHVESVSWISGRTDIICTLFFLAAFIFHIFSYRSIFFFPLALMMLAASFLSKEVAVAFPFLVLFYDLLKSKNIKLKNMYISLLYFIVLAAYLAVRGRAKLNIPDFSSRTIEISAGSSVELIHYVQSIVVMLNSYMVYFIKLLFPFNFNAYINDVPDGAVYTVSSILIFAALSVWAFVSVRFKSGIKAFAIIWIILTLGPSVLVSILHISTTPLAERYLFLPICGYSLIVSYIALPWLFRANSKKFLILFFILITVFLYFNVSRQSVWNNRVAFWNDISSKSGDSDVARINQGMALFEDNKLDEAIKVFEAVFETGNRAPGSLKSIASNNIGIAYLKKNDPEAAKEWFLKGVRFDPEFHKSYFHLALIDYTYANKSKSTDLYKKAEKNFRKAINKNKRYSRAYLMLAKIYVAYNKPGQAKEYAKKALDLGLPKPLDEQAEQIIKK